MKVYLHILRLTVASVIRPCVYSQSTLHFQLDQIELTSEHRSIICAGFTAFAHWLAPCKLTAQVDSLAEELSRVAIRSMEERRKMEIDGMDFHEQQEFPLEELETLEGVVNDPPKHLSEGELVRLMAGHGIGTDASIPSYPKKLMDKGLITVS